MGPDRIGQQGQQAGEPLGVFARQASGPGVGDPLWVYGVRMGSRCGVSHDPLLIQSYP